MFIYIYEASLKSLPSCFVVVPPMVNNIEQDDKKMILCEDQHIKNIMFNDWHLLNTIQIQKINAYLIPCGFRMLDGASINLACDVKYLWMKTTMAILFDGGSEREICDKLKEVIVELMMYYLHEESTKNSYELLNDANIVIYESQSIYM